MWGFVLEKFTAGLYEKMRKTKLQRFYKNCPITVICIIQNFLTDSPFIGGYKQAGQRLTTEWRSDGIYEACQAQSVSIKKMHFLIGWFFNTISKIFRLGHAFMNTNLGSIYVVKCIYLFRHTPRIAKDNPLSCVTYFQRVPTLNIQYNIPI